MTWPAAVQVLFLLAYGAAVALLVPLCGKRIRARDAVASLFSLDASRELTVRVARHDIASAVIAMTVTVGLVAATIGVHHVVSPLALGEGAATIPALTAVWRALTALSIVRYVDPRSALVRSVYASLTIDGSAMPHLAATVDGAAS